MLVSRGPNSLGQEGLPEEAPEGRAQAADGGRAPWAELPVCVSCLEAQGPPPASSGAWTLFPGQRSPLPPPLGLMWPQSVASMVEAGQDGLFPHILGKGHRIALLTLGHRAASVQCAREKIVNGRLASGQGSSPRGPGVRRLV